MKELGSETGKTRDAENTYPLLIGWDASIPVHLIFFQITQHYEIITLHLPTLAYGSSCFWWETGACENSWRIGGCGWTTRNGRKNHGTSMMMANHAMDRNACLDYPKSHESLTFS